MACLLSSFFTFSQIRYSSDPEYIISKTDLSPLLNDFQIAYPDTGVKNLHNYVARNFLGNIGLPQPDYLFSYKSAPLGFRVYNWPYSNDLISPQQVEYFRTKGPFASMTGIAGSKNEQMFRMLFSHTVKKRFNISLRFNRYGSQGFYVSQQTFVNNFYLSSNFNSKNNRFGFYTYLLINKIKHQENGGVTPDSSFFENPSVNKQLFLSRLSAAKRDGRQVVANFNPWLRLNSGSDSSVFSHYIDYKFNYTSTYYQYVDGSPGQGLYTHMYLDSTYTNDSTPLSQFINRVNYTIKMNKAGLAFSVGYSQEQNIYHQHNDSLFGNQQAHALLSFNKLFGKNDSANFNNGKSIRSALSYNTIVSGPNKQDMSLEWKTTLGFGLSENGRPGKRSNQAQLIVSTEQRHPDMIYNYWHTNNFQWDNTFKSVKTFQAKIGAKNLRSGLSVNILWQNYFNYLYFDTLAMPKQANTVVSNWSYNLNFDKVLFRHLGLRANVTYQTTNDDRRVKMPPLAAAGSIYYAGSLFKNNLQLQIGLQSDWYQAFKGYNYMPATNVFYVQNSITVGNYPFVDAFLSARIKPVQFFVKVENVLMGLTGSNYSLVPGYYQPDRAFRFGLTWLFFD
ncbi:MAG: putative porin [Bacteroidia bacterium]